MIKRNYLIGIILTAVVSSFGLALIFYTDLLNPSQEKIEEEEVDLGYVDYANITIIVDNNPNGTLNCPWGLCIYIETNNYTILLDTGPDPVALQENADSLGIDLSLVDFIVISHYHGDHVLGLEYIASINPNVTIYVPANMQYSTKGWINYIGLNYTEIINSTRIDEGIGIIGELYGPPYEHALVLNVRNRGLVTLVGCSHPGVENIVSKAKDDFEYDPYLVLGGFHLGTETEAYIEDTIAQLVFLGLEKIMPIHCSGDLIRTYMATNHPDLYDEGHVGYQTMIS